MHALSNPPSMNLMRQKNAKEGTIPAPTEVRLHRIQDTPRIIFLDIDLVMLPANTPMVEYEREKRNEAIMP